MRSFVLVALALVLLCPGAAASEVGIGKVCVRVEDDPITDSRAELSDTCGSPTASAQVVVEPAPEPGQPYVWIQVCRPGGCTIFWVRVDQ